ncbi:MAG: hypothetical protein A2Z32_10255 [Chloroflexi bacterium RBG_16_69_14]|nr:MAG: hypothetical protein A2Z32_10255 [Chloroflexi bacterium RBG_16_69_14]
MVRSLRLAAAIALLAALVVGTGTVAADPGDHGRKIIDTRLVGIPVAGQVLLGVNGGGRPWTIEKGKARLFEDGFLELEVRGLVLGPGGANEGINPIAVGRAIVVCNGVDKIMSATVPFSVPGGDAEVEAQLALPSPCLAPVIFFGSAGGSWFAVSG